MPTVNKLSGDTDIIRALELVTEDQRGDLFYKHPFEIDILKKNISWLERLTSELSEGRYTPSQARPVDVPKPGHHIRPALHLSLTDQVALSHLLLKCKDAISNTIAWSEGGVRQSHWVSNGGSWFRDTYNGWKHFREQSLSLILGDAQYVFITDISGYYENIDISKLTSELKNIKAPPQAVDQLSRCLMKWAGPRCRGIPQGYNPCHLLGELYLDSFDYNLKSDGFQHLRYLDDIRVFARTEQEARRALHRVTILLRERGLNLQTAKSKILPADEAKEQFDGVAPIIRSVSEEIARELDLIEDIDYVGIDESRRALENLASPPTEVITRTWQQFEQGAFGAFDKTLFHYLLNRLGKERRTDAINYAHSTLTERPEETAHCLGYLHQADPNQTETLSTVADIIRSPQTLFAYQRYMCLRWLYENNVRIESVLEYCRTFATWPPEHFIVRPYAISYIGKFATLRDFERLESAYRDSADWLERATIVCAYRHAVTEMRNGFYGRIKGEHDLVDRAIAFAKAA